jgi:hypothetical protein
MNQDMVEEAEIVEDLLNEHYGRRDDKIRAAIKIECDRQHVGEDRQVRLHNAYVDASINPNFVMDGMYLRTLAYHIEPDNDGMFRTTPVTFNGTVGGVSPDSIPRVMKNWIAYFNDLLPWMAIYQNSSTTHSDVERKMAEEDVDKVIKEFLDIHPFADGNGRTAWLLRVWLLNQWDDPQPLPDYYGEN